MLAALVSGLLITVYVQTTESIERATNEKASSDLLLSAETLDYWYPGEWLIENGELYKGDHKANNEMVDRISELTGGSATIFLGDERIATNVERDGQRMIGTTASEEVTTAVLENEEVYIGAADVVGEKTQTAYQPIYDGTGEPIGMWFIGVSQRLVRESIFSILSIFSIVLVVSCVLFFVVLYFFNRRLKRRFTQVTNVLENASKGDFTEAIQVTYFDEIGQIGKSYNRMREQLSELLRLVDDESNQVAAASEELLASSEETGKATEMISESITRVAEKTEEQSEKAEESNKTVSLISSNMSDISNSLNTVRQTVSQVSEKAQEGETVISASVNQMTTIQDQTAQTVSVIEKLKNQSAEIETIVSFITSVSEQTNLLALNAAIEAARAGESGKGFAVVAEEVRKLAEETSTASNQIEEIVQQIQKGIEEAKTATEEGNTAVLVGGENVEQAGQTFASLASLIKELAKEIKIVGEKGNGISEESKQLEASISIISSAVRELGIETEQIASSSEEQSASMQEITASSNDLASLAQELQEKTSQFKI